MDLMSGCFRRGLESNLDRLHKYIEGLEIKQRFDITTALTGNIKDYFEYKENHLTSKENHELGEDEKNELCQKIVEGALGEITKPKIKKSRNAMRIPKIKTDMARLLYGGGDYCTTCRNCGGFKCCRKNK